MTRCKHTFCVTCIEKYILTCIDRSRADIKCPDCRASLQPQEVYHILPKYGEYKKKFESITLKKNFFNTTNARPCPCQLIGCGNPNCSKSAERSIVNESNLHKSVLYLFSIHIFLFHILFYFNQKWNFLNFNLK